MMVQVICKVLGQISIVSRPNILDTTLPFYPGPAYPVEFPGERHWRMLSLDIEELSMSHIQENALGAYRCFALSPFSDL